MRVGRVVEVRDSRWALTEAYSGRLHQAELPTLVFSFVPRATIEQARKKYGRYFWFRAPDVSSAIVNAINSDAYLYSYRPLGINGASRHSNGASHMYAHINDKAFKKWLAEAKIASAEEPLDGRLTGGFITEVAIVDELFWLQNKFKSEIGDIPVDMRDFLKWIVQAAPRYFARFDEVVAAVETMAKRNGVDMREIQIPAKVPPPEKQDFTFGTDHRTGTVSYSYYTNTNHVRTVADFAEEASRHCVPVGQLIIQDRRSEATTTRAPTLGRACGLCWAAEALAAELQFGSPFLRHQDDVGRQRHPFDRAFRPAADRGEGQDLIVQVGLQRVQQGFRALALRMQRAVVQFHQQDRTVRRKDRARAGHDSGLRASTSILTMSTFERP